MLFSRIKALGISFDVFPVSIMPKEPDRYRDDTGSAVTVFLLPSIECDARIVMLDEDGACVADRLAASLAATAFLVAERGLPLDEVSIETESKNTDIEIAEKGKKYYIKLPKCKLLCSNKEKKSEKTEIIFSDILVFDRRVRTVICDDVAFFSKENMTSLILDDAEGCADVVTVASLSNDIISIECYSLGLHESDYIYSVIAAHRLLSDNTDLRATFRGVELEIVRKNGFTLLGSTLPRPMTFIAPDALI